MMNLTVLSFAILLALVPSVTSYKDGNVDEACGTMMPRHGGAAATTPSPFQIVLSATSYTANTEIDVTINALCDKQPLHGFMIQARRADVAASDRTTPIGTFTPVTDTKTLCTPAGALVHSASVARKTLTFKWTAPPAAAGHLVFKATMVSRPRTNYWVAVTSDPVMDTTAGTLNLTTDSSKTDILPVADCPVDGDTFNKDSECGTSKSCYSDCDSANKCTFLASFKVTAPDVEIKIKAQNTAATNIYAAVGFSTDAQMGDDSVHACVLTTGAPSVYNSFNTGRSNSENSNSQNGLSGMTGKYENTILECTFTRPLLVAGDDQMDDLNTPHYVFFAQGKPKASGTAIAQHGVTPPSSGAAINFASNEDVSAVPSSKALVKAHGSLMVIAWIAAASIGLVAARYFKPIWPSSSLFGQKIWFQIHRTCMITTFVATCIAFIIIFVDVKQWTMSPVTVQNAHPYLGVIVTILTFANPIMALFRPHPNTDNRPIFNWAHWGVGTVAYVLGIITVAIGTRMSKANLDENAVYIVVGFTVWQLLVVLCLELAQMCANKEKVDSYELQGGPQVQTADVPPKPVGGTLKIAILLIHVCVVTAFTIALIVVIAIAM